MIQFACPNCNMLLNAPHGKTGSVNPCPGCGEMVQVPKPDPAGQPRRRPRVELVAVADRHQPPARMRIPRDRGYAHGRTPSIKSAPWPSARHAPRAR